MPDLRTFQEVLSAAIDDLVEHGFDSMERVEGWTRLLRDAADRSLISPLSLEQQLRDGLAAVYRKMVDHGGVFRFNPGVERFTLERVKPALRSELDRRILASANLIKLNRTEAIEKTLRRFQGWSTSIPPGGVSRETRKEVRGNVKKSLAALPFEERRVLIDQGHKLTAALSEILAKDGGAIAGTWRSHYRQPGYNYREDHKERDGKVFLVRDSWAHKAGLVRKGRAGYVDESTTPGQEPFCRCLTPSTEIYSAVGISVISRRDYDGPCLKIITAAAPERPLVITPNHPVLTARGWVAAQTLNVGDDLIELVQKYVRPGTGVKNENYRPPTIAEIFDATAKKWGVRSIRDGAMQFHGDGTADGYIDIVRPARLLSFSVESPHCREHLSFSEPYWPAFSFGSVNKMLHRLFSALQCAAGSFREMARKFHSLGFAYEVPASLPGFALFEHSNFPLFRATLRLMQRRGGGLRSDFDTDFPEPSSDRGITDLELLCEKHGIPPSQIRRSKILDIQRDRFSGHVYNLQTDGEWYAAERIISHNCYYIYTFAVRELPEDMLTAKGNAALQQISRAGARADAMSTFSPRKVVQKGGSRTDAVPPSNEEAKINAHAFAAVRRRLLGVGN